MIRLFLLLSLLFPVVSSQAAILFYDDCEDAPASADWQRAGIGSNEFSVSNEQARAGNNSYKFRLPKYPTVGTDSAGKRVELRFEAVHSFDFATDYWIGWSMYIPANFVWPQDMASGNWVLSGQYHRLSPADACDIIAGGGHTGSMWFNPSDGKMTVYIAGDTRECSDPQGNTRGLHSTAFNVNVGGWNDFVMHVRWGYSAGQNPIMQVWHNGVQVVDDNGINCWNDVGGEVFWKIGIYGVAEGTAAVPDVILYWDEIRVGDANSSYAEVSPGGAVAPDPLIISTATLGNWTQGSASSGTLSATGGTTPYRWYKVSGPSGLTVAQDTGAWSITPDFYGSYNVQIRCTDDVENSTTKTFTGTVTQTVFPDLPTVTAFDLPETSNTLEVPVTTFTGSATAVAYMIWESSSKPPEDHTSWSATPQATVAAADEGIRTFYPFVKDANGNVSDVSFTSRVQITILIEDQTVTGWTETATDDVWSAACSITPKIVYFDSALGTEVTALVDVTSPHVWYYSTGTLYTYNTTDPDTAYTTITASTDVTPDPVTPAEGVITTGGNKTITTTGEKVLRIR